MRMRIHCFVAKSVTTSEELGEGIHPKMVTSFMKRPKTLTDLQFTLSLYITAYQHSFSVLTLDEANFGVGILSTYLYFGILTLDETNFCAGILAHPTDYAHRHHFGILTL